MRELKNDRDVLQALLDGEIIQDYRKDGIIRYNMWLDGNGVKTDSPFYTPIPYYTKHIKIKPKTININGYEVPQPLRKEPGYNTIYYTPVHFRSDIYRRWEGSEAEIIALKDGLIHLIKENAAIHRRALASFTTLKEDIDTSQPL